MARAIRLKEYPPSTEIIHTPTATYVAARDKSLAREGFKLSTDENGFILAEPHARTDGPSVIFLGDSVVESMYAHAEARFCSRLQHILRQENGVNVNILNAGYSGATILHSFNTFINKIVPLRPASVVLMTGIIDVDAATLNASFWSRDCWIEPMVDVDKRSQWRDRDRRDEPSFDDRSRLMAMFAAASRIFGVPVWHATIAHRQVYDGEFVAKAFPNRAEFDREVSARKAMNEITRQSAINERMPLFDLEPDLAERTDIFYDMFHLTAAGGEAVARSLIKNGFVERLQAVSVGRTAAAKVDGGLPIHVITLDRTPERLVEFKTRNGHLRNVIRVRAVDGKTLDRETLVKDGYITPDCTYSAGALGCAMSHIALWRMAVAEQRAMMVTEDDAVFSRHFEVRSQAFLASLPADWDFVQWGWGFRTYLWVDVMPGVASARMVFNEGQLRRHIEKFQTTDTQPVPMRLLHSFGTMGYSISPVGAQALLDRCLPLNSNLIEFPGFGIRTHNEGIDCAMSGVYPSLMAYVSVPPLVVTENKVDDSTIRGKLA